MPRPIVRRAMMTNVFLLIGYLGHVSPDSFGAEPNLSANSVRAAMTKTTRWYREHAASHQSESDFAQPVSEDNPVVSHG